MQFQNTVSIALAEPNTSAYLSFAAGESQGVWGRIRYSCDGGRVRNVSPLEQRRLYQVGEVFLCDEDGFVRHHEFFEYNKRDMGYWWIVNQAMEVKSSSYDNSYEILGRKNYTCYLGADLIPIVVSDTELAKEPETVIDELVPGDTLEAVFCSTSEKTFSRQEVWEGTTDFLCDNLGGNCRYEPGTPVGGTTRIYEYPNVFGRIENTTIRDNGFRRFFDPRRQYHQTCTAIYMRLFQDSRDGYVSLTVDLGTGD